MPHLPSASLRPSLLALAIVSTLPGVAFAAADEMTVTATGNARSAFEAPMMVSVIDASAPEKQTASSAADLLRNVPWPDAGRHRAHQRAGREPARLRSSRCAGAG